MAHSINHYWKNYEWYYCVLS